MQATQWIYDNIEPGSVIANEHFDDPLPFNMFGKLAWEPAGLYRSLDVTYPGSADMIDQLQLYDEDTPEKLVMLLDALDQADYIVMSSGRLSDLDPAAADALPDDHPLLRAAVRRQSWGLKRRSSSTPTRGCLGSSSTTTAPRSSSPSTTIPRC